MRLSNVLKPEMVVLGLRARTRDEAISEIVAVMARDPRIGDAKRLLDEIMAREGVESTCLGFETAIPHARTDLVREMVMAVGRSDEGVRFGCGRVAKLIFVVANPRQMAAEYLQFVGALARAMRSDEVRGRLMAAGDAKEYIQILSGAKVG
ncbi:MAG TPA: PTS sugar transporter subunit IIA [Verrucomicrobiae bacterium]|nr:PTS sugar transporter subunit IIA [Verrucomicrobiae bacterium]